ncbi:SH3 domain-containing protein [Duganella phyllosphaerae]|uniref:Uncharacterized protein n=1 Tax=Duganella phyllosphaerae TaxID=762836 RepID=A0A1E7X6Y5_9BURK|nr:SH3 domain-containing protein [Duganella phyllosphaerae]OFA08894.1 hypothetical protein DUPY_03860 [Duganella phyllosphaerae]
MNTATLTTAAAFAAGLALTWCLCAWLTPRRWWRRPTLRALAISAAGAWGFGSLIFSALPVAALPAAALPAAASPTAVNSSSAAPATAIGSGSAFRVHRDLNLRRSAGVDAPRLLTVPAGATVVATGRRHGDWWQVTAIIEGRECSGWASSLWLRRSAEPPRPRR